MQDVKFTIQQINTLKDLIESAGTMDAIEYIDQIVSEQSGTFVKRVEMTINIIRQKGCVWNDVDAEIKFRESHFAFNDIRLYGYNSDELKEALDCWNIF